MRGQIAVGRLRRDPGRRAAVALAGVLALAGSLAAELPDFRPLLDFSDPAGTETRLAALLPAARASGDSGYLAELLTQIARTHSRRGDFPAAHRILDEVEPLVAGDGGDAHPRARVRYWLERARTFHLAEERKDEALALFGRAWELARAIGDEHLTIDAAHMLAMGERGFEAQRDWTLKALAVAEGSSDPEVAKWIGSLTNNLGWTLFDHGDHPAALAAFERYLAWRAERGPPAATLAARWNVGRVYRALGRFDEALALQEELLAEYRRRELPVYGYVHEELAELYHRQGDPRAREHFRLAHEVLADDVWMVNSQPERLARLQRLGQSPPE